MKKTLVVLLAAGGLLAAAAVACLTANTYLNVLLARYPDAISTTSASMEVSLPDKGLYKQADYRTEDTAAAVQAWYVALLDIEAGSDTNNLTAGNCVWLTKTQQTLVLTRTVSVIVCSARPGTRISVSEHISLGR